MVTGGAKRVGRAICRALAARGCAVAVHYRSSEQAADELMQELVQAGVPAATLEADLAQPDQLTGLLDTAEGALDREITLLVNNASAFPRRTLGEAQWEDLDEMMRLHAWAPLELSRQLQGREGAAVVNLLDTRVLSASPEHVPYLVSKQALAGLTRSLALQLAPEVRVNAVAPGAVLPPKDAEPGHMEQRAQEVPLLTTGTPEDVAEAVAYLASARFVTGQTLFVDGGRHLV